jgi:nicotinamidase/pyrazinamidase
MMNVLILIDIQNDFIPGGSLPVPRGNEIIKLVSELQGSFELVVATQDWHPDNHKSFATQHPGKKQFETISLHGLDQVLWPDHCVQGTKGAEFHDDLNMNKVEAVFRKGMNPDIDSYSGFYDNGYKKATGLAGYLRDRGVKKVYLCGLAADYCVAYTAKDALKENFETYVIEDATRAIDAIGYSRIKDDIITSGGQYIQSHMLHRHM